MDKELERLKQKYPIGSKIIYNFRTDNSKLYYYNKDDLNIYKGIYGNKLTILDNNTAYVETIIEDSARVDGYLYTINGWNLVQDTWDGFIIIDEPDEKKGQKCLKSNE